MNHKKITVPNFCCTFTTIATLVLVAMVGYAVILLLLFKNMSMSERGQFGDMFGPLTALFSGLAFAGVVITLIMQRRTLEAQWEDITNSAQAVQESKESARDNRVVQTAIAQVTGLGSLTGVNHDQILRYESLLGSASPTDKPDLEIKRDNAKGNFERHAKQLEEKLSELSRIVGSSALGHQFEVVLASSKDIAAKDE